MIPTDRPVLTEPVEQGASTPFRIPLGQAMHLNGALKRGVDVRTVVPKRCPCGVLFLAIGKGSNRAKFCDACRATQKCRSCNLTGRHSPRCAKGRVRPCRGCGEDLGHDSTRAYCDVCRATQCPECRAFAGQHRRTCLYERRRRRPGLTVYHGVVTEDEILGIYVTLRPQAVRLAWSICGELQAEDCVHDVAVTLLEKREFLPRAPGVRYFLTAVKHTALRRLLYSWERFTVRMDPGDLERAEEAMARGASSQHAVRLPADAEPVA